MNDAYEVVETSLDEFEHVVLESTDESTIDNEQYDELPIAFWHWLYWHEFS